MRDALRYRFLFEQMVRRELRRKYQGSALGVAWYVVNPLVLMGAYYLMFGVVFKVAEHEDYPLFLIVGLVVWIFFSQSLLSAAPALLDQGSLIRKARFPRETIPAAVVTVQAVTFLSVLAVVAVVTVALRGAGWSLVLLPVAARGAVRVRARPVAARERPARLLPRRRADPRGGAAAVVLPVADLLHARRHHATARPRAPRSNGSTRWRRSSPRSAT